MKYVINTNVASPHTVPLALALAGILGDANVAYAYYRQPSDPIRSKDEYEKVSRIAIDARNDVNLARDASLASDVLIENVRDFDVMDKRAELRKPTFYVSERWFRPFRFELPFRVLYAPGKELLFSGFLKMAFPFAIKRAIKICKLLTDRGNNFMYLPIGVYAARDMARLCGLMNGDYRCLFRSPEIEFEGTPGGRIWLKGLSPGEDGNRRYCLDKMRMWGYFVQRSDALGDRVTCPTETALHHVRVLWVGRMLNLKRVDDVIRAVGELAETKPQDAAWDDISLDVYGDGPDRARLARIACRYKTSVALHPYLPYKEVRKVMRNHDVYVLSSNAVEGWGAVVNEALEEGMIVIGTHEAGSCATILPKANLYAAGDWRGLADVLHGPIAKTSIGKWTPYDAALAITTLVEEMIKRNHNADE